MRRILLGLLLALTLAAPAFAANVTSNTVAWWLRVGGSDTNGGGYDKAVSGALATTLAAPLTSGATSITVASASGWPSSGNYYAQIGNLIEPSGGGSEIVLVTGGQGTTTWTVTRAQLGTSALPFAAGVTVNTNYARANTAPESGTLAASTASTTFVDAGASFNGTEKGNTLWLASGIGSPTVSVYIVQSVTNGTALVLDRASGTYTAGVWKLGGAWQTGANISTSGTPSANILPGQTIYARASGSGSVGSPDYAFSNTFNLPAANTTVGVIAFIGENGRPVISGFGQVIAGGAWTVIYNVFAYSTAASGSALLSGGAGSGIYNCVVDETGFDNNINIEANLGIEGNEVYSDTANTGTAGTGYAIYGHGNLGDSGSTWVFGNNVHDFWGIGIADVNATYIVGNIVAGGRGVGVKGGLTASFGQNGVVMFNTIYGNFGSGILPEDDWYQMFTFGNIIANHTTSGTYGIDTSACCGGLTQAQIDRVRGAYYSNNWYSGNNANALNMTVTSGTLPTNGLTAGDSTGVAPGFVAASSENFALAVGGAASNFIANLFTNQNAGSAPPTAYLAAGGVQRQAGQPAPASGGNLLLGVWP